MPICHFYNLKNIPKICIYVLTKIIVAPHFVDTPPSTHKYSFSIWR